jgi:GT2 family glycosyltransferase
MGVKIITPYVFKNEIKEHHELFWELDIHYQQDTVGIGSDLMFQKIWKQYPEDDIFILHSDMTPHHEGWFEEVLEYVKLYPEAGMFGCLLLYPVRNDKNEFYIQCAGGHFKDQEPDHFGSGLVLENKSRFKKKEELEIDRGQFNKVREVAWTTFGGCYLRRSFIEKVGDFSSEYEWTYNRDVDYCLRGRELGERIYQIPVRLFHHESKDNKRIKDDSKMKMEMRNLKRLQTKWGNSKLYKTLDKEIKLG